MSKLAIRDLKNLKITKVKPWAVYFTYDGDKYLLHESSDCGECNTSLFKRTITKNGRQELEYTIGDYGGIPSCIRHKTRKGNTYNQIDINYFVWKLTKEGFFSGIYSDEILEIEKNNNIIKSKIKALEEEIYELKRQLK